MDDLNDQPPAGNERCQGLKNPSPFKFPKKFPKKGSLRFAVRNLFPF
jgi:hypothetical protein